jgi:cytochrome c biogenesis protein ResB
MYQPKYAVLKQDHIMGMVSPKVKKYVSVVDLTRDGQIVNQDTEISVNNPLKHKKWKIYQHSYDGEMGRWSQMSMFEIIRDPWLPVVYTGIFMMLLGSVYLLWVGRKL